jgi:D-ribose pyranose/furanose isomerase RbsD
MKKTTLINPALSEVIARLGHTDMLVLAGEFPSDTNVIESGT